MVSSQPNLDHLRQLSKEDLEKAGEILSRTGYYKRLQSSNDAFVTRQAFRVWLASKDSSEIAKVISRLAVLAEPKVYLFEENPNPSLEEAGALKLLGMPKDDNQNQYKESAQKQQLSVEHI